MGSENKKKALTLLGAALCVILIPILVINLTLIIKSYTNTEEVPTLGGYCPLIVLTGSMEPEISSGDMIICHTIEPSEVKTGDVISFFDPEGNGLSVVTHRVVEIVQENGSLSFRTKGDANNVEDKRLFRQKIWWVSTKRESEEPGTLLCLCSQRRDLSYVWGCRCCAW